MLQWNYSHIHGILCEPPPRFNRLKGEVKMSLLNGAIVYHGSTSLLGEIDVAKGKPYKDFGRGFYVTKSKQHATTIARRNKRDEDTLRTLLRNIEAEKLPGQIYFSSNKATGMLTPKGQVEKL